MGMGLRRGGRGRRAGRRNRRVGFGRRRNRFGRRRRGRGGGLGLLFLCCMGKSTKNVSYGQDIQHLQQQQMMTIQAIMAQQQQQQPGQQQQMFGQQQQMLGQTHQPFGQPQQMFGQTQPVGQQQEMFGQQQQQQPFGQQQQPFGQQQYGVTPIGMPAAQGSPPAYNEEHVKELQSEQMELLNEIMKRQAEEKDPVKLQELFNEQNMLLAQMSQLQTAGYAYPEPLPAPAKAPPSQEAPMQS